MPESVDGNVTTYRRTKKGNGGRIVADLGSSRSISRVVLMPLAEHARPMVR